jgi:hypothetical protein
MAKIADIDSEIQEIRKAVYGEEVRGAIVSALTAINRDSNGIVTKAVADAQAAKTAAEAAKASTQSILGTAVDTLNEAVADIDTGLSENQKTALLNCFAHVAWADAAEGATYYQVLADALSATSDYPKLSAAYNIGSEPIYTDTPLTDVADHLTVRYYSMVGDTGAVISKGAYTISGNLVDGSCKLTIGYNGITTTVNVDVVDPYAHYNWKLTSNQLVALHGASGLNANTGKLWVNTLDTGINPLRRRCVACKRGITPFIEYTTSNETPYYPIPIPSGATKYTISPHNTNYRVGGYGYSLSNGVYTAISESVLGIANSLGGARSKALPSAARNNWYLNVVIWANKAGDGIFDDDEPAEVTVTFE